MKKLVLLKRYLSILFLVFLFSCKLSTDEDGESFTYSVDVIYDGENMQWEIVD